MKNKEKEVFKPVKNYEGYYEVSNMGRVKSLKREIITKDDTKKCIQERILVQAISTNGYFTVGLSKTNEQERLCVHILMAESFLDFEFNTNKKVLHKNKRKKDNRLENLEVVAYKNLKENPKYTDIIHFGKYKGVNTWKEVFDINPNYIDFVIKITNDKALKDMLTKLKMEFNPIERLFSLNKLKL